MKNTAGIFFVLSLQFGGEALYRTSQGKMLLGIVSVYICTFTDTSMRHIWQKEYLECLYITSVC